ncbi:phosphatase PAP2 family protein [Nocardia sp. CDC160]|uniref:phosphatase PAP2 family protein n=1 Tax=Nocardia sp. CDC160 TaxID=3112166 RepID=UPI002DBEFE8E|nr:phosphatase PAP2 family protein [Nocardia sp. CDC160]MEC3916261.1 phosphatase PAP2 family protein [Nocardia sp. CDC160]
MLSTPPAQEAEPTTNRPHRSPDSVLPGVLIALALAAAVLVLTCVVVYANGPAGPDSAWLQWFIDHRTAALTTVAKAVSIAGDTTSVAIYSALACVLLAWRKYWEQAVLIAVAAIGAGALTFFGKLLIGRDRPPVIDHLVTETNHSYPSGHALGSTVVIGVLVAVALPVLGRLARILALVLATLFVIAVGLSRLYLGVHWPTDILAGWLVGLCWLTICLTARPYLRIPQLRIYPQPKEIPSSPSEDD